MKLKQNILDHARRLGFSLAGFTTPEPPPHFSTYEKWLASGHHGNMYYLTNERALTRRADPRKILAECQTILVLASPYPNPKSAEAAEGKQPSGRIAAYAWGDDYHDTLIPKLQALVSFIEGQVGKIIPNRYYTDTGPILERDLAQRAGLGWIGKNSCLINPKHGSYFLLAEILLGLELEPDDPFSIDYCGNCTRCIEACPTHCILPNRTIDARRCISYLTIELKEDIPEGLRPLMENWIFGCDACQAICPWNRFSISDIDASFAPRLDRPTPNLIHELSLSSEAFNQKFKNNPVKRAKRRGYLRNVAVALGNSQNPDTILALEKALDDPEPMVREHAIWALNYVKRSTGK